jgi:hypothetical protein
VHRLSRPQRKAAVHTHHPREGDVAAVDDEGHLGGVESVDLGDPQLTPSVASTAPARWLIPVELLLRQPLAAGATAAVGGLRWQLLRVLSRRRPGWAASRLLGRGRFRFLRSRRGWRNRNRRWAGRAGGKLRAPAAEDRHAPVSPALAGFLEIARRDPARLAGAGDDDRLGPKQVGGEQRPHRVGGDLDLGPHDSSPRITRARASIVSIDRAGPTCQWPQNTHPYAEASTPRRRSWSAW